MPAFSGGYAAGGAAIAVKKNILGQGHAESSLCLYAAGTGALLFGVSRRPRGRSVSFSVFSCPYTGAAVRCSMPSEPSGQALRCSVFCALMRAVLLCCRCGAVQRFFRTCVQAVLLCCCSVFYAFMRAVPLRRDAAPHGGGNGFLLRGFQGSRRLCLFGFLLICSNFKKSPNSAVSLGSNRIHFPSRYVCALS